jgi:GDP-L-fucose synthase
MKILVTGGTGLVGKAIEEISHEYNHEFIFLSSINCDLTNYEKTYSLFDAKKPDYVIHLAANVGGLYKNMNNKVDMLEKNLLINYNVVKCSHEFKVKKLISCLSTCIFPDNTTYPINESMLHDGPPHNSNDAYAYSKRLLEIHSKAYKEQFGDDFICVIPTNIYGKHDNYNLNDAHVIPALIHKCYLAKKNNENFTVMGTGKPLRQFIFSKDLARLLMWCLEKYEKKDNIILSVGEEKEVSIEHIAREIANIFDYQDRLIFDTKFSDGQYKKTACNTKLMETIGNFEFTNVNDGLKESVKWFIDNYDKCRK